MAKNELKNVIVNHILEDSEKERLEEIKNLRNSICREFSSELERRFRSGIKWKYEREEYGFFLDNKDISKLDEVLKGTGFYKENIFKVSDEYSRVVVSIHINSKGSEFDKVVEHNERLKKVEKEIDTLIFYIFSSAKVRIEQNEYQYEFKTLNVVDIYVNTCDTEIENNTAYANNLLFYKLRKLFKKEGLILSKINKDGVILKALIKK